MGRGLAASYDSGFINLNIVFYPRAQPLNDRAKIDSLLISTAGSVVLPVPYHNIPRVHD